MLNIYRPVHTTSADHDSITMKTVMDQLSKLISKPAGVEQLSKRISTSYQNLRPVHKTFDQSCQTLSISVGPEKQLQHEAVVPAAKRPLVSGTQTDFALLLAWFWLTSMTPMFMPMFPHFRDSLTCNKGKLTQFLLGLLKMCAYAASSG